MIEILGNGYVKLIESWGSEEQVISSARMSTNGSFKGWGPLHSKECSYRPPGKPMGLASTCCAGAPGDEKLLKYLWDHKHTSPFEQAGITLEMQVPLVCVKQIQRHRTFSYSEFSGRYAVMPDIYYIPDASRIKKQSDKNKQSTGSEDLPKEVVDNFLLEIAQQQKLLQETYEKYIAQGIPRELARINTPLSKMTRMRMSGNLKNWFGFLRLRLPSDVQEETRIVAQTCFDLIQPIFPRTSQFFIEETTKD